MDTLLLGGVTFDTPPNMLRGDPVTNHTKFKLYGSYNEILKNPYQYGVYYVASFSQSLRGLVPGAPVEYRGIQIGRVVRILLKEFASAEKVERGGAIPVLIYLEPGRLEIPDTNESLESIVEDLELQVTMGLRASIGSGNLLTGKKLINLDYYPDVEPAEMGMFLQYSVIPSIETGLGRIEHQISTLLDKLNALPLDQTVSGANDAIRSADKTLLTLTKSLEDINMLLESDGVRATRRGSYDPI
jgi:paraquat-inducible protein B